MNEPKGIPEDSVKPDPLKESVAWVNTAFKVAFGCLEAIDKSEKQRYSHLESNASLSNVLTISDSEMTRSLLGLGYDERRARAIPAIYMGERGGILVDAVVVRKGIDVSPVILLHEFIHRAAEQKGLHGGAVHFHEQMYQLLDFPAEMREEMKIKSPAEYKQRLSETKEEIRVCNEGVTQWATLYLANRTPQFNPPVKDETYADEVGAVNEWFHDTLSKRGMQNEQIEGLMLDLSLTGDFLKVKAALPLGDNLANQGIGENFYVTNLLRGINSSFSLSRFDRILGRQNSVE